MRKCPEGGECNFTPDFDHDPFGAISCEKCGASESQQASEMEQAFRLIEAAIDASPRFTRIDGVDGEPLIVMGRFGVTIRIPVKLCVWGPSKKSEIRGEGSSIPAAAANLVARLEAWWLAWLCGLRP